MTDHHEPGTQRQRSAPAGIWQVVRAAVAGMVVVGGCASTPPGPFVAANKPVADTPDHAIAVLELTSTHADRAELTHHLRNELIRVSGVDAADTVELKATVDACRSAAEGEAKQDVEAKCSDTAEQFFARERVVSATLDAIGDGYSSSVTLRVGTDVKARVAGHGTTPSLALSDAAEKLRPHLNTSAPPSSLDGETN